MKEARRTIQYIQGPHWEISLGALKARTATAQVNERRVSEKAYSSKRKNGSVTSGRRGALVEGDCKIDPNFT
jgi:hypothetical protein